MQSYVKSVLMLIVYLLSTQVFAEQKIQLQHLVLTDGIDRPSRQFKNRLTSPLRSKKVYVWMQLRGSAQLLEELRQSSEGSLPIRHEWYKYQSDEISAETPDALNLSVDLSVGSRETLTKLSYQIATDGTFSWRVWSGKEQLSSGWWRIDLVYANGEPVLCPIPENKQKPCRLSFEVKR